MIAEEKKTHKKGSFMNKPIKKDKRFLREDIDEVEEQPFYQRNNNNKGGFQQNTHKPFPKKQFVKPVQNFQPRGG